MAHDTTRVLLQQARLNEQLVISAASIERERIVSWVRVLYIVARAVTMGAIGAGLDGRPDWSRIATMLLYLTFAIGTVVALRRATPNVREGNVWGVIVTVADYAFNLALILLPNPSAVLGGFHPERAAAAMAVVIVFAIGRQSALHIGLATLLAMQGYLASTYAFRHIHGVGPVYGDIQTYVSNVYVCVTYLLVGFLIWRANNDDKRKFVELKRRERLTSFLPRQVADRILRGGEEALAPISREVTVLFSDIRGFTSMSERMDPRAVLSFLHDYFGHMSQIVKGHDGTVSKYIGDGLLAFWNVPERNEAHAEAAVRAALDMRRKLEEINAQRRAAGEPEIRIGIGLHTGTVAAGALGGADLHEYTVIGDAVNLASRIEGLNKEHGTDILVSETTWRQLGGRYKGRHVATERVKGREEAVSLWAVEGRAESAPERAAGAVPALAPA